MAGISNNKKKADNDVPIFLRKTYHMIDTCDSTVACWSEDGDTFVVKQPETFEKVIIPQFFKHSKFSSFVRQLNFYGFRKIKFTDTIRIDTALEAQTANFWRFRHENFRQGRPDLLAEIKRSNSNANEKSKTAPKSVKPNEDVTELKTELKTLKDRIELMTTNIGELTSLVKNVTLDNTVTAKTQIKQELDEVDNMDLLPDSVDDSVNAGRKRKKVEDIVTNSYQCMKEIECINEIRPSSPLDMVIEDVVSSTTLPIEMQFSPTAIFPPEPILNLPDVPPQSDQAFVDDLFNAFDDDMDNVLPDIILSNEESASSISVASAEIPVEEKIPQHPNAPDTALMHKLSDALTVLPKDIQEMLVNRLITTVTNSDVLKSHMDSVCAISKDTTPTKSVEKSPITTVTAPQTENKKYTCADANPDIALPLAAATLTALMTQWSAAMKDKAHVNTNKSLPVISIHA